MLELPPHIEALKKITGIKCADCRSCSNGHMDTDGEPGGTYECGIVCSLRDKDYHNTYAYEDGIDEDAEKACWIPEFWQSSVAGTETTPGEDDERWMERALDAFMAAVKPSLPVPAIEPPDLNAALWLRDGWHRLLMKNAAVRMIVPLTVARHARAVERCKAMPGIRRCRACGCSENDCRQCIEKTGHACHWAEGDLCSACKPIPTL